LSGWGAAQTGKPPGTVVAVKVRHPGVSTMMQRDFVLMQRAAALSAKLPVLRDLNLEESVRQFGAPLREQLDLASEVRDSQARAKHVFSARNPQSVHGRAHFDDLALTTRVSQVLPRVPGIGR
jgi:predicted unusual protein kinase regulating ubiquinone biosynthesis (AarF/ABC1/UbiB family)